MTAWIVSTVATTAAGWTASSDQCAASSHPGSCPRTAVASRRERRGISTAQAPAASAISASAPAQ